MNQQKSSPAGWIVALVAAAVLVWLLLPPSCRQGGGQSVQANAGQSSGGGSSSPARSEPSGGDDNAESRDEPTVHYGVGYEADAAWRVTTPRAQWTSRLVEGPVRQVKNKSFIFIWHFNTAEAKQAMAALTDGNTLFVRQIDSASLVNDSALEGTVNYLRDKSGDTTMAWRVTLNSVGDYWVSPDNTGMPGSTGMHISYYQ